MREKIERLSRGEFEYELPTLSLSENRIDITVEAGKQFEGSLLIKNSANRYMKGAIYSSHRLLNLRTGSSFGGIEYTVIYQFDASFLKPGDTIQGEITIVTDCGEQSLPFHVRVEAPYCNTSLGKVKDLFQFANLARMDWTEAKKVFRSEDFERVILQNDLKYKAIYHNLVKNISTSQALEEFLIAIHKKPKIDLTIDKTSLEYIVEEDEFMDKLILTKNHWGYVEIRVSTDAPFLQLEQKFLWADRFIGNSHQISFLIVPGNMRPGNNYGRIWIKTVFQTITVEVVCRRRRQKENLQAARKSERSIWYGITRNYLDFRMDRRTLSEYLSDTENAIKEMTKYDLGNLPALLRVHLELISGQTKAAGLLLEKFTGDEATLRKKAVLDYCAYLYLNTLYRKDEDTIKHATETIRRYYVSGHFDWRILWFLLYTDKRYEKNRSLKLADIREQFEDGCHSPILYYEAVQVFEQEPYLLRELTDFEIQVLQFGIKNNILSKETALQYTYLAGKQKVFHPVIFQGLTRLYNNFKSNELLSAICCMLIKGLKKSNQYFKWYRLGVEEQLRITELYEYYMHSVDETREEPLPQPILLYFIYNSSLNDRKRAFLYANIIKNKEKLSSIYRTYVKRMEVFSLKQLEPGNISPNLAVLYREFLNRSNISDEIADLLPEVMFLHELTCNNPNMAAALVFHRETGEEETQPLSEGKALIQLYSQNTDIFMVDATGNRYAVSVDYSLKPLLPMEEQEIRTLDYRNHPRLLLHNFTRYHSHRVVSEEAMELRKQVLKLKDLKEEYYNDCLSALIDYYYENYNEELLERYLSLINIRQVKEADRIRFLDYLVIRKNYEKALGVIRDFGYEGISIKRLVRMCSGWIIDSGIDTKDELIVNLCYYSFSQGKYDEAILGYLVKHYFGPTVDMFHLWQTAKGFELGTHDLEERLLVQILFTEGDRKDSCLVFGEYYKSVSNHLLVRAFISYNAYQYLVFDRIVNDELFSIMRRELNYEENDICLLAWMKYNSKNHRLTQSETDFIAMNMSRMEKKGVILPFFMNYSKWLPLPDRMYNKYYIEYKADPAKQVYLHYRLLKKNSGEDFITERMLNIFQGIHVKEFVLFYHETLQYYITEEVEGEVNVTERINVQNDREAAEPEDSKYSQVNRMLMAREMQDEKTLLELMVNTVKSDYIISECFQPLN